MKVKSIKFNSFKTIKGDSLDIENDITCLVGINEAGKSNVLLGVEKLDREQELTNEDISRHSEDYLKDGVTPALEAVFSPSSTDEEEKLKLAFGHDEIKEIRVVKVGAEYRVDYPEINYAKSDFYIDVSEPVEEPDDEDDDDGVEQSVVEGAEEQTADEEESTEKRIRSEVVSLIVSMLPRFYYFDSVDFEQYFLPVEGDVSIPELMSAPETHKPVINLLKLAEISPQDLVQHSTPQERMRRTTRLDLGREQANQKLLRAFWPVATVQIDLAAEGDILKIRIRENKEFLPGERSRGLQWALAFNIFFLASTNEELKDSVLLIDEPGIFLHIDGQSKMISSTFPEIAKKGNQVIYTTHLPYLIDKNFPERIRILEKEEEDTKIGNKAWSTSEFGSIPEPVRTALGLNIGELFLFGSYTLIVEGPVDHIYLRIILEKFDPALLNKLTIVPAYGVEKTPKIMTLVMISGYSAFGLIDADKDIRLIKEQFTRVGIDNPTIENISVLSKGPTIKTIEDIIPETIMKEAVYRVYKKECDKRNRELNKEDIPLSIPRQSGIETYFRTKLTSNKHKLLKMDIARSVKEVVLEDNDISEDEWTIAKELVLGISEFISDKNDGESQDDS